LEDAVRTFKLVGFVLFSLIGLNGCGTMGNMQGMTGLALQVPKQQIYGGVHLDAYGAINIFDHAWHDSKRDMLYTSCLTAVGTYVLLIDLPLSAVGDTVTLPYILYKGEGPVSPECTENRPAPWPSDQKTNAH
jgi:uncharacterized protein YceK